jgi:hypothetical protein
MKPGRIVIISAIAYCRAKLEEAGYDRARAAAIKSILSSRNREDKP